MIIFLDGEKGEGDSGIRVWLLPYKASENRVA